MSDHNPTPWQSLRAQILKLEPDGDALAITLESTGDLNGLLRALLAFTTEHDPAVTGWVLELETHDQTLHIYKVSTNHHKS